MVTRQRNIALGILTADCCPVLFADPETGIIGAAHAGWRGALAGVIPNTVKAMVQIGAKLSSIRAGIGPTIQQASYEVGAEVRDAFVSASGANSKFFIPAKRDGFWMFDLPGYAAQSLRNAGVTLYENLGRDTYPPANGFFSYRRRTHEAAKTGETAPDYGRQLSTIILR
jgi:YfiH family protein